MRDNQKGFATVGLAMAVMIVASILIITFSNPMLNTTNSIKNAENNTEKYVSSIASKERLHSKLNENISYKGELRYDDIETAYNVNTKSEDYESKSLSFNESGGSLQINNETDINISISSSPKDSKLNHSYSISVEHDGVDIIGEGGKSLTGNNNIKIGKNYLYNEENDSTNYGIYNILVDSKNADVSITVTYNRLAKREIEVTGKDFKESIVIENEEINNLNVVSLYYK